MTDYDTAAETLQAQAEEANKAAIDARADNVGEGESDEEYAERIRLARSTGIFGDTPTDPTSGDVQVPSSNEEDATVAASAVDAAAEEGNEEAQEESPEQAKRQPSGAGSLSQKSVQKAEKESAKRNEDKKN